MPKPLPVTYVEALEICESLAEGGSLDPREARGDEVLEAEVERQEQAIETMVRLRETEGALLGRLKVPVSHVQTSLEALMPAPDADVAEVVPALLLSLELARSDVLDAKQALDDALRSERRRQQEAVALLTDLVVLHRDELSKVVIQAVPNPAA